MQTHSVQASDFRATKSLRSKPLAPLRLPAGASAIPAIALASDLEMQQADDNGLPAMLK